VQVSSGGEMQTMRYLGHEVGDARFRTHWDTFITEEDIANIGIKNINYLTNNFLINFDTKILIDLT
jgi:hypothetical protein